MTPRRIQLSRQKGWTASLEMQHALRRSLVVGDQPIPSGPERMLIWWLLRGGTGSHVTCEYIDRVRRISLHPELGFDCMPVGWEMVRNHLPKPDHCHAAVLIDRANE